MGFLAENPLFFLFELGLALVGSSDTSAVVHEQVVKLEGFVALVFLVSVNENGSENVLVEASDEYHAAGFFMRALFVLLVVDVVRQQGVIESVAAFAMVMLLFVVVDHLFTICL